MVPTVVSLRSGNAPPTDSGVPRFFLDLALEAPAGFPWLGEMGPDLAAAAGFERRLVCLPCLVGGRKGRAVGEPLGPDMHMALGDPTLYSSIS